MVKEEEVEGVVEEEEVEGVVEEEEVEGVVEEKEVEGVVEEKEVEGVVEEEEVEEVGVEEVVQKSHLKSSLTAYQRVLHPLALLILGTKTRMFFALYKIQVHMFHTPVHLICLSFILMMALWTEYCSVHMHTQSPRKRAKKEGISFL